MKVGDCVLTRLSRIAKSVRPIESPTVEEGLGDKPITVCLSYIAPSRHLAIKRVCGSLTGNIYDLGTLVSMFILSNVDYAAVTVEK